MKRGQRNNGSRRMSRLRALWFWVRFGKVRQEVRSVDGGIPSEVAYLDRKGQLVGYWAYGYFDPSMPYRF